MPGEDGQDDWELRELEVDRALRKSPYRKPDPPSNSSKKSKTGKPQDGKKLDWRRF
jgi:hypothetical protein